MIHDDEKPTPERREQVKRAARHHRGLIHHCAKLLLDAGVTFRELADLEDACKRLLRDPDDDRALATLFSLGKRLIDVGGSYYAALFERCDELGGPRPGPPWTPGGFSSS